MSRRGETVYEERDYYAREERPPPRAPPVRERERDFEEVDIYSRRREREPNRPEFLREDYDRREDAGPVVLRERERDTFSRGAPLERRPRSPSPVRREVREVRERFIERSPSPPPMERVRTRVVERERERSISPEPERLRKRVIETRERIRERSPSPVRIRERIIERERTPSPPRIERISIRDTRERSVRAPSPSPSPSPSPPPSIRAPPIHQEIITHHRHVDHGFERARAPSPPPPPRRSKETDIDIYTSRNNTEIDIRQSSNSRSRTPQPSSRRDQFYEEDVIYERERDKLRVRDDRLEISRRRSVSARPEPRERERVKVDIRDDDEADYYARKAEERAYIGEGYNGATKDWAIVDVPPGTERVRMDGVGGGAQEITWQRYNGVRRSKFVPERERDMSLAIREPEPRRERESTGLEIEISSRSRRDGTSYEREYERIEESSDRRLGPPRGPKTRNEGLWTEITKDLVIKEAIDALGYDYEETDYFFYILQYLRYEDVLELVQYSERIRRDRQERIREIERERMRIDRKEREERRRGPYEDERIIEREIIYDGRRGPRRSGGW